MVRASKNTKKNTTSVKGNIFSFWKCQCHQHRVYILWSRRDQCDPGWTFLIGIDEEHSQKILAKKKSNFSSTFWNTPNFLSRPPNTFSFACPGPRFKETDDRKYLLTTENTFCNLLTHFEKTSIFPNIVFWVDNCIFNKKQQRFDQTVFHTHKKM